MRDDSALFAHGDLSEQLRELEGRVSNIIDRIPKNQFQISNDCELKEHVTSELEVRPLTLLEDQTTMNQQEVQVDVSRDLNRHIYDRSRPLLVPGTQVEVDIPYIGENWLFALRTNPYKSSYPYANYNDHRLRITVSLPHDAHPERFKSEYDRELKLLKEYILHSGNQVRQYNERLPILAQQAIDNRRERLGRHGDLAALLDIPVSVNPDAPPVAPVKLNVRRAPPLPVPPESGLQPEPGITYDAYEQILHFIRHQGRTFERTPSTFAKHGEEELRDIILAQLNGHFEGKAAGEVFRGNGKTDICIEEASRAAFVGECKIWSGPSGIKSAIDQLLSYLTWRDSKSALIVFNVHNKDFSRILESLPTTLAEHPLFIRDIKYDESGEWQLQMRSLEDQGRRVNVHVFVFNLYQE